MAGRFLKNKTFFTRLLVAACGVCFFYAHAHAVVLPWLDDPMNSEERIANYGKKNKPLSCPPPPDTSKILNIREVVIGVICYNTSARTGYISLLNSSEGYSRDVLAAYLPTVSASMDLSRSTEFSSSTPKSTIISRSTGISSASVKLFDLGQRELSLESAELGLVASGYTYESSLQDFISRALQAYYTLLVSQNSVDIAEEALDLAKKSTDAALLRYRLGIAPLADKLQAEVSLSQSEISLQQSRNSLQRTQSDLALLMGLPTDSNIVVAELDDSELMNDPFNEKVRTLMEYAKKESLELKSARVSLKAAELGYKALKRSNLLSVEATATSGYSPDLFSHTTTRGSSIGLNVTIPVFSAFTQTYNERIQRRELESTRVTLAQTERTVEQSVWNAWHSYETSKSSWQVSWDQLAVATELKDVALGRYQQGIGSILEVLTAQNQYSSALQTHLQTRLELLTARIALIQSVGVLDLENMESDATIPVETGAEPDNTSTTSNQPGEN